MITIPDDIMEAAEQTLYAVHSDDDPAFGARLIARAILAERERCATDIFDREALMMAVSGDGDPYVKVQFKTLKEMQSFHRELCKLAAIRSQS